jgi:hypothetical protein
MMGERERDRARALQPQHARALQPQHTPALANTHSLAIASFIWLLKRSSYEKKNQTSQPPTGLLTMHSVTHLDGITHQQAC